MLRKITAIALISILICSQSGKILGYIGCAVYNITSGDAKCDCEKQFHDAKGNDIQSAPGKFTVKEKTEEIFTSGTAAFPARQGYRIINSEMVPEKSHLPAGFHHTIFQPPRA